MRVLTGRLELNSAPFFFPVIATWRVTKAMKKAFWPAYQFTQIR